MNRVFDMMAGWPPLFQGAFLLLFVLLTYGGVVGVLKYMAVMVRGWPPQGCVEYEEEGEDASV